MVFVILALLVCKVLHRGWFIFVEVNIFSCIKTLYKRLFISKSILLLHSTHPKADPCNCLTLVMMVSKVAWSQSA